VASLASLLPRSLRLGPSPLGPHAFFAAFTPALSRYSPPLCRGNKMAATRARCARIRSPPFVAPRPTAAPRAGGWGGGGARAPGPQPPPPRGPALSVAASRARAHVPGAHTPSGPEHPRGRCRSDPFPYSLFLCSVASLGSRRVPVSQGGKHRLLCPHSAESRTPSLEPLFLGRRIAEDAFVGSYCSGS
jgi:hypothetical protein